ADHADAGRRAEAARRREGTDHPRLGESGPAGAHRPLSSHLLHLGHQPALRRFRRAAAGRPRPRPRQREALRRCRALPRTALSRRAEAEAVTAPRGGPDPYPFVYHNRAGSRRTEFGGDAMKANIILAAALLVAASGPR